MEGSLDQHTRLSLVKDHADTVKNCIDNAQPTTPGISSKLFETINLLLERSACSLKLKRYEEVISDCQQIVELEPGYIRPQVQSRLIFALFQTGKYFESQRLSSEWVEQDQNDVRAKKTLERITLLLKGISDEVCRKDMLQITVDDTVVVSNKFLSENSHLPNIQNMILERDLSEMKNETFECIYCNLDFISQATLNIHCRSESHLMQVMSDEDQKWIFRPPPRGVSADHYNLCECVMNEETCRLGEQCTDAHSEEELYEWKERFEYRQKKIAEARMNSLYDDGNSYTEKLLEKWLSAKNPSKIMKETVDDVELEINPPKLNVTVSSKQSTMEWTFTFSSDIKKLARVSLLHDANRAHFSILSVEPATGDIVNNQEWINSVRNTKENAINEVDYKIKVGFTTDIFGTFRQTIVFGYGEEPVLVKKLCVDVVPKSKLENLEQAKQTFCCSSERWHMENCDFVPFDPKPSHFTLSEEDEALLSYYPAPQPGQCIITQAVMEPKICSLNYCNRQHELLHIEEMAQFEQLSRFNISTKLHLIDRYLLLLSTNSTAKYTVNGELYAHLKLELELSEDTAAGRLVLTNCNAVLISPEAPQNNEDDQDAKGNQKRKVYEAIIEDRGKDVIYLRLSKRCVDELKLVPETDLHVQVQFQLNRIPMCEMHLAVDKLSSDALFIFPDISTSPNIPWNPDKQWNDTLDDRLNPKQKEAILAITCDSNVALPPILLIGPFGTGKTFALAQAIKQIVLQPHTRVLVCTHSNSAADLYIKDYLHDFCKNCPEAKPLRVFYKNRWVQTVDSTVLKYSLLNWNDEFKASSFRLPTMEDVTDHRVIVTTLSTARYLTILDLPKGFFTHILIDEAAQALECETLMPLVLAGPKTKLVLAGDHMQLSPEVFSQFCSEKKFGVSLLERLYDHYPVCFSCRILLCENYRSHSSIIRYTSELFYDNKLISSGKQRAHGKFHPLTFFTARGEDVQDKNSTAFYNDSEVYELAERVSEVLNSWPSSWGPKSNNSIGVVSPYYDQVVKIRSELRKRKLYGVNVERVLNVQGKQFRAIFLSTVRTRYTCQANSAAGIREDDVDYGFLSNAKLLNTAITRAQSLVAVVGDPITLCSIGKCRKLWEKFIKICDENHSLHGITWTKLRAHLDGVELKKSSYVLNPLAPEFIPLRLRHEEPYLYLPYPYHPSLQFPTMNMIPPGGPMMNNFYPTSPYQPLMYSYHPQMMPYSATHPMSTYPQSLPYVNSPMIQRGPYTPYNMMSPQLHPRSQFLPRPNIYNSNVMAMPNCGTTQGLPNGTNSAPMQGPKMGKKLGDVSRAPQIRTYNPEYHPPPLLPSPRPFQGYPLSFGMHPQIYHPRHRIVSDRNAISPSLSPSSLSPLSPKSPHKRIVVNDKATPQPSAIYVQQMYETPKLKRCELDHYFQIIRNHIPADCNLELLLKTPTLQLTWVSYVQKFQGPAQAQELHRFLEMVRKLESIGHTSPPYVGKVVCKICKPYKRAESHNSVPNRNIPPQNPSVPPPPEHSSTSSTDKPSYSHVLLNGKESIPATTTTNTVCNGNVLPPVSSQAPPVIPKMMTVEELEASFLRQADIKSTAEPVAVDDSAYLRDTCPVDVVSQILEDEMDSPDECGESGSSHSTLDNSLLFRLHQKAPSNNGRSNSWTPALSLPQPSAENKRYSCYNLPSSLNRGLNFDGKNNSMDTRRPSWHFQIQDSMPQTHELPSHNTLPVSKARSVTPQRDLNSTRPAFTNPLPGTIQNKTSVNNHGLPSFSRTEVPTIAVSNGSSSDSAGNKQPMTYAGVVRSALQTSRDESPSRHPLAIVQDLKGASGLYHYFT